MFSPGSWAAWRRSGTTPLTAASCKPLLPEDIPENIGAHEFFAMAVPVNGNPIGLIYADGGQGSPLLDADQFEEFKRLCVLLVESLEREPQTGHFH